MLGDRGVWALQWYRTAAFVSLEELPQVIWDIIDDHHPVSWRHFPVSTATALSGGLKKGQNQPLLKYKVCLLASHQVRVVQGLFRENPAALQDWRIIAEAAQGSLLQALMISRLVTGWCG